MRWIAIAVASLAAALGCAPQSSVRSEGVALPSGWIAVDPPAPDSPDAWCVGHSAGDQWNVALSGDSSALLVSATRSERWADTVPVADGLIVGDNRGEFGGAIWSSTRHNQRDTLRVEGRGHTAFAADNLHAFVHRQGGLYALVGLAHLSFSVGELLYLSRDRRTRWHARHIMTLSGSPAAFTLVGTDSGLVLTGDSLISVKFDSAAPGRRGLFSDPLWPYAYPSSLLRDRDGVIYIGMRSAVARLTPDRDGYREAWLVPAQCSRRVPMGEFEGCRCEAAAR